MVKPPKKPGPSICSYQNHPKKDTNTWFISDGSDRSPKNLHEDLRLIRQKGLQGCPELLHQKPLAVASRESERARRVGFGAWVKTQETPGEHQNRWQVDVHPPQSGIAIGYATHGHLGMPRQRWDLKPNGFGFRWLPFKPR